MAIGKPEKIGKHKRDRHGTWKPAAKRAIHKKLRMEAKLDPENAPKKGGYRGWSA